MIPNTFNILILDSLDIATRKFQDYGVSLGASPLTRFQIVPLNRLVKDLKTTYAIWDKFDFIGPVVGGTAIWHSLNLKDPTTNRMTANGTITNNEFGTQGNGVNGYWDSNFDFAPNLNSGHISCYSRTNINEETADFGVLVDGNTDTQAVLQSRVTLNTCTFSWDGGGESPGPANTSSLGLFTLLGDNSFSDVFKNGVSLQPSTGGTAPGDGTTTPFMAANGGGVIVGFSTRQYAFFSYGSGLTTLQAQQKFTAVQTYQSGLGRAV